MKTKIDKVGQEVAKHQLVLTVLRGGEMTTRDVASALGFGVAQTGMLLREMAEIGELEKAGRKYRAGAAQSVDAMRGHIEAKSKPANKRGVVYTNHPDKHPPVKNPDAMGSSGRGFGVRSSLGPGVYSVVM